MKYILAVSGGPDSMAMLAMFKRKAQAVCVVNYNMRNDSHHDVEVVQQFCNSHNIKCYVHEVDKKIYKKYEKDNFQTLARHIRYEFFRKIAEIEQNKYFLVAHNLNDHLETAYMQFERHSKSLFYGIARKNEVFGLKITRPLIHLKKQTLQRFCDTYKVPYAIDSSNNKDIYQRNKVRKIINTWDNNQLIEFNKKVNQYNKSNKKLRKKIDRLYKKWNYTQFECNFLLKQLVNEQYYLVYKFLQNHGEHNNNQYKIESILVFLKQSNQKKKFRLENNRSLCIEANSLVII